jgi:ABC-type multidrug transport system fused ATPase/permease subunit
MNKEQERVRKKYLDLRDRNDSYNTRIKRKQLLVSIIRLMVFITGIFFSVVAFGYSVTAGIGTVLLSVTVFVFLIIKFTEYSEKIRLSGNLIRINQNEIDALGGNYSAFDGGTDMLDIGHDFSGDIDLFGEDSLFRYLNRTVTGPGRSSLGKWLADPYSLKDDISDRQEAVRELAGKLEWRQKFMALGLDRPLSWDEINGLSRWLEESNYFFSSIPVRLISFIFPAITLAVLYLTVTGLISASFTVLLFIINLFIIGLFIKRINRIHALVTQKHFFLISIENLIRLFEAEKFHSNLMISIRKRIFAQKGSVADKIRSLDRIVQLFDNRLNMFAGLILNGLLLWDFHCLRYLERWRREASSDLPAWLELLGEVDALSSLANYSYNNPGHCYPEVKTGTEVIEAVGIGHPLLSRETRIVNDFSMNQKGKIVIITGANMAGKSTFLRTVAVNMVLAMAGAPVCAASMKLSPLKLFTSMRTTDSLSKNESYFYAELKRLKDLKERLESREPLFFILDEILKGTNSTDKSIGSKMFLRMLVELGGTGLIATHDISLGEMEEEFPSNVINKCFEIEIDGEEIKFDYILRDGITRKMNAAVLMKQMGIA